MMSDDNDRASENDNTEIRPATRSLKESLALLLKMPKPSEVESLERTEMPEREFD